MSGICAHMSRNAAVVGLSCLLASVSGSTGPLRAAPQQFRGGVEVVEVTVTVTDERGQPVTGLTREDFTVLEDDRPQAITVFGQVNLQSSAPLAAPPGPRSSNRVAANDIRADGRVFALVLDDQLTQPFRTLSVRRLARQFVENNVSPDDLVGVFSTGGRGALTQEFTTDHSRVLSTIDRFHGNRIRQLEKDPERIYGIRTAMDGIAQLAAHLRSIRGRRVALLWFSEGIDYNIYQAMRPSAIPAASPADTGRTLAGGGGGGSANDAGEPEPTPVIRAVQETLAALSLANVALYSIDPRGLYSPDGEWIEFNASDNNSVRPPTPEEHARSIESLRTISERTGGFALVNTNEFGPDFGRIVAESSQYYVLGYSPATRGNPGDYRRISVRLRPGLRAAAREGYVVQPARAPVSPPKSVLAALDDSLPQVHLPLRVQAIPLPPKVGSATRPVQIVLEIDGGALSFREENGQFSERLELAIKTLDDLAQEGHRSATEMALPPLSAVQRDRIARNGLRWLTTLDAMPGHYSLRVAAHSTTAGRTGSVFLDLDVPSIDATGLFLGELALTATSAAETPTAGTPSILPPLPGPVTTRRVFRQSDTITAAAAIVSSTMPVVTASLRRLAADSGPQVTGTIPVTKSEGGPDYVLFSLPPDARQPGRFAITLTAEIPGGVTQRRDVVVEIVKATP